jgi:myo-inositol catabolism protein IolC
MLAQQEHGGRDGEDDPSGVHDRERRPALMVSAIRELQEAGVEPDVWKLEGLDRREDCVRVAETARRDGRSDVGCIILGRGEDEAHVHTWLTTAAGVPGFIGFAVGRTTFWDPLIAWREQKSSREVAVAEIARRYGQWVDVFEKAHAS